MADDGIGGGAATVSLKLGQDKVVICESYEVRLGVLTQPAAFSLKLGWGDTAKSILNSYPANTPFELRINDKVQQTGTTDGFEASDGEGATTVTIRGRDALAQLHDAYVTAETSLTGVSFATMVDKGLKAVGLGTASLVFTNDANRSATSGVGIGTSGVPTNTSSGSATKSGGTRPLQAKIGDRWYELIKRQLDRAGLFLWAAGDGSFVLSEPNAQQSPTYRIVRRRGQARNAVNVTRASYRNETTGRFSECIVYGRGGGRKFGCAKSKGAFIDDEMFNRPYSYNRPLVIRDAHVTSVAQAEFLARRRLAEARRAGWALTYTLGGHTVPSLRGGTAVWTPDTTVEVIDDEYGLNGTFWIESVVHQRAPTTTTITLMRPEDLVFGSDEDS